MILRHKDKELLRFEWVEPEGVRVVSVNERERPFLPLGMKGEATDEGLWKWLCRRTVPRSSRLKGFRFRRHRHYNLTDERLAKIEGFIQNRIAKILECGVGADASLRLPAMGDGSVNRTNKQPLAVQIKSNIEADPFITYVELSEIIGVAPRTIARKMKELQEAGEIRRVGADKNGHWEVMQAHSTKEQQ